MDKEQWLKLYREEMELYIQYHKFIAADNIGLSCNFGWLPILRELFEYWESEKIEPKVAQIKEKFGDLRVYFDADITEEQYANSWNIIDKTVGICDICGEPGDKEGPPRGWILTRCSKHKDTRCDVPYHEIEAIIDPLEAKLRSLIGERKPRQNPWSGWTIKEVTKFEEK